MNREYRPEARKHDHPRVPVSLRASVYLLTEHAGLANLGVAYYRWAAGKIARSLLKFQDVHSVALTDGVLARCIPGVSTLDFIVLIDPVYEEEFLNQFHKVLRKTRRLYPVLGEVHVVGKETWRNFESSQFASLQWFKRRHRFSKNRWEKEQSSIDRISRLESRISLALLHYWKAHGFLCRSMKEHTAYHRCHFQREISKAIDCAAGTGTKTRMDLPWEKLMTTAMLQIDECAEIILRERRAEGPLKLAIKEKGSERFAIEIAQRQWFKELQTQEVKIRGIGTTSVPGVMSFESSLKVKDYGVLFRQFYLALSDFALPPLLLSENGTEMIKRGLGWGPPGLHLDWLSPSEREDADFLVSLSWLFHSAIRERLSLNAILFRGTFVSASVETIEILFKEIFFCFLTLSTNRLTNDMAIITTEMKRTFPNLPSKNRFDYLKALKELQSSVKSLTQQR